MPLFSVPVLKNILPANYLVKSLQTYPSQEEMIKLLNEYGFSDLKNTDWLFGAIAEQIGTLK